MDLKDMTGHLVRRLQQRATQVFADGVGAAGLDLTPVQFAALQTLEDNPGLDQAGIAAAIAYDRATIGGVIDRLEAKGLVSRVVSRRDRRAREVSLTNAGEDFLLKARPVVEALQGDILDRLSETERDHFRKLARKALDLSDGLPEVSEASDDGN